MRGVNISIIPCGMLLEVSKQLFPTCEGKTMFYHIISSRKGGYCTRFFRFVGITLVMMTLDFWSISQKRSNLRVDTKIYHRVVALVALLFYENSVKSYGTFHWYLLFVRHTRTGKFISHYYGKSMRLREGIINHVFNGKNIKWNKLSFLW